MQEPYESKNELDAEDFQHLRRKADNFIKAYQLGYFDIDVLLEYLERGYWHG